MKEGVQHRGQGMGIAEKVGNLGFSFIAMNPPRVVTWTGGGAWEMDLPKGRASESAFITPSSPDYPQGPLAPPFLW